ncbi:MAG: heavy metal translocating P-type ATPase [Clostridia bacterium]|nr:heavy metal translocating P-type ATPase [Clostridia bacterium]
MRQFDVTGMSCAACQARVEKAVSKVPGVTSCAVSLLTNAMGVEGTADDGAIIRAVEQAGYGASVKGAAAEQNAQPAEDPLADRETPALKRRLIASLGFLILLMYVSMGHMMLHLPLPAFFEGNHVAMGLAQLLLTVPVMIINRKFFVNGFNGLRHRAPNMDTLVGLGSSASFAWSVYALFAMTDAQVRGGSDAAAAWMHEFYFESAAMILTLITVGKMLEARSKGRTTSALKALMRLSPKTAVVLRDGKETEIPVADVRVGDLFAVRPGGSIPVDGVVEEGESSLDESALTGESIPADKGPGDAVSAATINRSGYLVCRATRVGGDTTLAQIIRMVSDAAATKAPIAKLADRVSAVFVPAVIGAALITFAVWMLLGKEAGFALARAISVLVISCPCALGLATPVAIMVGSGVGARHGILFKTAESLEETGKAAVIALDKTGTITVGEPSVTDLCPAEGVTAEELLDLAAALEAHSEHPLARAVAAKHAGTGRPVRGVKDFRALPGSGLQAVLDGAVLSGGSLRHIGTVCEVPDAMRRTAEHLADEGKTPLCFARDGSFLGVIAVADTIREDSAEAVAAFHRMGMRVVMLTGDNRRTAEAIGRQAGVDEVVADVRPDGKEAVIRRLQAGGRVAMVGDGINDAPALARADVSIAIGAGTDVAVDAADVVLMRSRLSDAVGAMRLSRATLRNVKENLFWAFIYNVIGIPLAAGAFIGLTGWEMNPMIGAAAMSLSSFCVVSNALRLNWFDISDARHDNRIRIRTKETKTMTKTLTIDGMMCKHCEARVKKALEAVDGVGEAVVSHEAGTAVVTLLSPVADDVLKKAVEDQDYTVKGIA